MPESTPPKDLLRLLTGYFGSQVIYVAAELGLADLLASRAQTAEELAAATGTHARSLYRLLRALASLGIFAEDTNHRFALTLLAEPLRSTVPGSQRAAARMLGSEFFRAWGGLLNSIRTGEPSFAAIHGQSYFDYLAGHPEQAQTFDAAMTALNDGKTSAMLDAYDCSAIRVLADVGGGNGDTLIRTLGRYPALHGLLFDLPHVVARARTAVETAQLTARLETIGGSFLDSVPSGADLYLLRHILHNWDDDHASRILRNLHAALHADARFLVVERLIAPGNEPSFAKLQDLTMLVAHGGVERTEAEFQLLFEAAGLRLTKVISTAADVSLIEGAKA